MTPFRAVIDIFRQYGITVLMEQEKNDTADRDEFGDQAQSAADGASTAEADAQGA